MHLQPLLQRHIWVHNGIELTTHGLEEPHTGAGQLLLEGAVCQCQGRKIAACQDSLSRPSHLCLEILVLLQAFCSGIQRLHTCETLQSRRAGLWTGTEPLQSLEPLQAS